MKIQIKIEDIVGIIATNDNTTIISTQDKTDYTINIPFKRVLKYYSNAQYDNEEFLTIYTGTLNVQEILKLPMKHNDASAITIKDYLKSLLRGIWTHKDSFTSKLPFGNSGWEFEIYNCLVFHGVVEGTLNEYDDVLRLDIDHANKIIEEAILSL